MRREDLLAVESILREFKLKSGSLGMSEIKYAVVLLHEDGFMIHEIGHRLYPEVARFFENASASTVEKNIRFAKNEAWEKNPQLLSKVMGKPVTSRPSAGEFLDSLRYYMEVHHLFSEPF